MSDERVGDDLSADMVRLRDAVACELHAQLAMRGEVLHLADIPEVAHIVAMQLRHGFHIEWAPRWTEEEGDDGPLGSDAAVFHASRMSERESEATDRFPVFDHGWPRQL
jgi:hypothetical protein